MTELVEKQQYVGAVVEILAMPNIKNTMKLFDYKLFAYCSANLFANIFCHGVHNKQIW